MPEAFKHTVARPSEDLPPVVFDESEMDKRWGSFVEGMVYQPHLDSNGKVVKLNVLAATIGLPVGTKGLVSDILTRAEVKRFGRQSMSELSGYNDSDTLLAAWRDTGYESAADSDVLDMFDDLSEAAEEVIRARHPYQDHPSVVAFFEDNRRRRDEANRAKFKAEGLSLLMNPDSELHGAKGHDFGGLYVMNLRTESSGRTSFVDALGKIQTMSRGNARPGFGHDVWLEDWDHVNEKIIMSGRAKVSVGFAGDGTIDVLDCRGCSSFFDEECSTTGDIRSTKESPLTTFGSMSESGGIVTKCGQCNKYIKVVGEGDRCRCPKH